MAVGGLANYLCKPSKNGGQRAQLDLATHTNKKLNKNKGIMMQE
jgi:hypothetical protein